MKEAKPLPATTALGAFQGFSRLNCRANFNTANAGTAQGLLSWHGLDPAIDGRQRVYAMCRETAQCQPSKEVKNSKRWAS